MREGGVEIPPELSMDFILEQVGLEGFPVPIPLPTSLNDVLQYALRTAASYFSADMLAAIGAGTVFPGVGNFVGAMVAFVMFMAENFGAAPQVPKAAYECRNGVYIGPGTVNTPVQMMAGAQVAALVARKFLYTKGDGRYIPGTVDQCITDNELIVREIYPYVKGTAARSTLPEVQETLVGQIKDGVNIGWGSFSHQAGELYGRSLVQLGVADIPMRDESVKIIAEYEKRLAQLTNIGVRFANLAELDTAEAKLLKVDLLRELKIATVAMQRAAGTPMYKKNAGQVGIALTSIGAVDKHLRAIGTEYADKVGSAGVQSLAEQARKFEAEERGAVSAVYPQRTRFTPGVYAKGTFEQAVSVFQVVPIPTDPSVIPAGAPVPGGAVGWLQSLIDATLPGVRPRTRQAAARRLARRV